MHLPCRRLVDGSLDRLGKVRHQLHRLAAKPPGPLIGDQVTQQPPRQRSIALGELEV